MAFAACGPDIEGRGPGNDAGVSDDLAGAGDDGGNGNGDDGGSPPSCQNPLDQQGCGCNTPGATRPCYTGAAATENKGACRDGTQTCAMAGEFSVWGPCMGDVLPHAENCNANLDLNCNGSNGCDDPACAGLPNCCAQGDTRPCYSGPQGTDGVGQCHGGMQVCDAQGAWGACMGEQTPGNELGHCADMIDNDCNGKTDCKDLLCLFDKACQPKVCNPNDTQPCYDGPQGTQGVGPCKGGTRTCKQDGSGWGDCMGQVLPGMEGGHCNDMIDNDCNGLTDCKDPACAAAQNCCMPNMNPADGTIYACSAETLYKVDPNNFTVTTVGNFNVQDQITDVAVTPAGDLYGVSFTDLYSINKANGQATHIAPVPGMGNNALTFLPDGTLLAADGNGWLKRINPNNGQAMDIGNYGNGLTSAGDLVAVRDGTMFGTSATAKGGGDASGNNPLLRVNTGTGAATVVGPTGYGSVLGLAYANAKVIGFTEAGEIIQVDPQTGAGALLAKKNIVFWGAGQSPLVDINRCP